MGACDFMHFQSGHDPKDAFLKAHEQAKYENGHGGYSGTIAEKDGFVIVDRTVRTERAAAQWAEDVLSDHNEERFPKASSIASDKWGPAAAIPVCLGAKEEEFTLQIGATVDPDRQFTRESWERWLRAEGKLEPTDTLLAVRPTFDDRTRIEMARTEGKAVIRYFYVNPGTPNHKPILKGDPKDWLSGFPSMADWRKHAKAIAEKYGGRYEAYAITRRFDAEPLDVVEAKVTKRKVTLEVVGSRTESKGTLMPDAWLFFGMASM